jgi:glycosyltransferase involved in cell wall biosynthesis
MRAPVLVVIPAYNEAGRIGGVVASIRARLGADVLVVDDGSVDGTAAEARAAGAMVAPHATNLGYGAALQTGYRFALARSYGAVVQLDADGQHDPDSVPALVAALDRAEVVVGSRFLGEGSYHPPPLRRAGMAIFGWLGGALCGQRLTDPTSGFQAISREALVFYAHERFPADYPDADVLAMATRAGLRLLEVPVRMLPAPSAKSMHGGLWRPLYYVLRMSLALLLVPLRRERP